MSNGRIGRKYSVKCLNQLWRLSCRREASAFRQAMRSPEQAQSDTLARILGVLSTSTWGRRYGLSATTLPADFQQQVPLSVYDDYASSINEISVTGLNPLSSERVKLLEPTSGTSSGEKLIPYTASLRREFQRSICVWIDDMFTKRPNLMRGRAYWSVSPPLAVNRRTASNIPIGFEDDTSYLGFWTKLIARRLLAVPSSVARQSQADQWRLETLMHLIHCRDLTLISVWSPTFLIELIQQLAGPLRQRLAGASTGEISGLLKSSASAAELTSSIWPALAGISCWTDASAAAYVPQLSELFPTIEIFSKGLISTEGCISIPILDSPGNALALRSHFLEFLPADSDSTLRVEQLQIGELYRVVLTTGGGLYRYQTGDWIEVVGFQERCPLVRFRGRAALADLVGEKLAEPFVQDALNRLARSEEMRFPFALLIPDAVSRTYRIYLRTTRTDQHTRALLACRIDSLLSENPYYLQARQLGQLASPQVYCDSSQRFEYLHRELCIVGGTRAGSVKPIVLETNLTRAAEFIRRVHLETDSGHIPGRASNRQPHQ